MRPMGLGLIAALVIAVLAPVTVLAAKGGGAVDPAARKQGMAEAPAVVQSAGLNCQVADARFVGKSTDPKTKASSSFYEVACATGGMGYVLQTAAVGTPPTVFTCIEANTVPEGSKVAALPCILPGNADPKAALTPMLSKAGYACTPTNVRGVGQSKSATYFEVACQEGPGYIVVASAPFDVAKAVEAQDCLNFEDGGNVKCVLTDRAKRLAIVDTYAAAANNGCVVKDRGFLGTTKDGTNYFEAACQNGKGYVYRVDNKGTSVATDCAKAQGLLGGCKLTDARAAETEQAGLYTRLAKAAGSDCAVAKYASFPSTGADDIVELVCTNGPGGVGFFKAGGKGEVLDCAHALVAGYKCGLNDPSSANAALTADLRKFDQKSCTVSNSRMVGKTAKGTVLVEVACADGLKGYMIEYNTTPVTAVASTGCAFAGGCKLPGNT